VLHVRRLAASGLALMTCVWPLSLAELRPSPTLSEPSRRPWPEPRLRAALEPFLKDREQWPDFLEFQRAGLALLYRQVELSGGPRRWAEEYGLPFHQQRRTLPSWSEERLRSELADFLPPGRAWPTVAEFRAAGREYLRMVVDHFGGTERWAREFGRELGWRQLRKPKYWTDERIERVLRRLSADTGRFPVQSEFAAAGCLALWDAIGPLEHRKAWAQRLGLPMHPRACRSSHWTEERIEETLRPLIRGRSVYPTRGEFKAAGLSGLYLAISRSGGGHDRRARRHGLVRQWPRRAGSSAART
jgi:hypothetical protein